MTKVKICGLTNFEDAEKVGALGADYLGFVFFENSPRHISTKRAKDIIKKLRGKAEKVGLFYDQDIDTVKKEIQHVKLDVIQLHGNESPDYAKELSDYGVKKKIKIIKSFRVKEDFDFKMLDLYDTVDFYLFDTFKEGMAGGTGISFDWKMLEGKNFKKPIFLAGGLKPDNVKKAIDEVHPYALDVASGVESKPGKKDIKKVEEFINVAKR